MPKVVIRMLGVTGITRKSELEIRENITVEDLLKKLVKKYGEALEREIIDPRTKGLQPFFRVLVNGRSISFLESLKTKIKAGDEITILPPVGGG